MKALSAALLLAACSAMGDGFLDVPAFTWVADGVTNTVYLTPAPTNAPPFDVVEFRLEAVDYCASNHYLLAAIQMLRIAVAELNEKVKKQEAK